MPRDSGAVRVRNNPSQSPSNRGGVSAESCVGYTKGNRRLTRNEERDDGFGQHPKRDFSWLLGNVVGVTRVSLALFLLSQNNHSS